MENVHLRNVTRSEGMLVRMAQLPLGRSFNKDFRILMKVLLVLSEKRYESDLADAKIQVKRCPLHFL